MSKLKRVVVYYVDDGDDQYDQAHEENELGDFYLADEVDDEMKAMLEKLAAIVAKYSLSEQVAFCSVVSEYFPDLVKELDAMFMQVREAHMLQKALSFPERYGVAGKLGKPK